ncbi:MAG: toprim domain-containing protein [Pseudomonadota bacterium]
MLIDQIDSVVHQYAPPAEGSYQAFGKYFTLNPGRADRSVGSFYIQMTGPNSGRWKDHAVPEVAGEGYGDIIDLIQLSLGCDAKGAFREARAFLGLSTLSPADEARRKRAAEESTKRRRAAEADDAEKIKRRANQAHAIWLSGQERLRGTPVEYYLRDNRAVDFAELGRTPGVLRYVPDCHYEDMDPETGEWLELKLPAMVALITNHRGQVVGCHRTYLGLHNGRWGKAAVPQPKKVLGRYGGGYIPIWKGAGPRGGKAVALHHAGPHQEVYIAEGIEDALSAVMLHPTARVLAAISLSNLGSVNLPDVVDRVTLIADLDENAQAQAALQQAIKRHQAAGRRVRVFQNVWGGKDLNDAFRAAREHQEQHEEEEDPVE